MKTTGYELKKGDKFTIEGGQVIWTVIEENPVQYENAFRAKGIRITAPWNKSKTYNKIEQ